MTPDQSQALSALVQQFSTARVLCLGDVMLDSFNHGSVERISPERPVPVFRPGQVDDIPGGAANVARNVTALGAHCTLVGVVGEDAAAAAMRRALEVDPNLVPRFAVAPGRPTTHKVRFTAAGQHLLRLDSEETGPIGADIAAQVVEIVQGAIAAHDVLILSDYAKGLLTSPLLSEVIALARGVGVPVIVDPKSRDFARYAGATLLTPNALEAERATGVLIRDDASAAAAGQAMLAQGGVAAVLVTRGAQGMSLIETVGAPLHLQSDALEVFDVVGAGDTVIAALACVTAAGGPLSDAAACANIAAGIVVGKRDTATVAPDEVLDRLARLGGGRVREGTPIMLERSDAAAYASARRAEGKRIGFTNGVFDLVHPGHVALLRFARETCDILIVGINSDASVQRLGKGPERPINGQLDRALVLGAFGTVDATIIFDEDTPLDLIRAIRPDVLIKGADYTVENVVGSEIVLAYGGKVRLAPLEAGKSSTGIIRKAMSTAQ